MDSVGAYMVIYFALLIVFGAYFVVCGMAGGQVCRAQQIQRNPMSACRRQAPCNTHTPVAQPANPLDIQLNLFLAVLKIKFAKAQSLLADKRKAAMSTQRPSTLMRLIRWTARR